MIRVGVVGLGVMGSWGIREFAAHSRFEVCAICDSAPQQVTDWAGKLRGVRCYSSFDDLIAAGDIDLIYVATPPSRHHEAVMGALRAGLHVVCEKPLAVRTEDAEDMANAAAAAGVVNAVNFPLHYAGTIDVLRGWLAAGNLGRLRHIELDLAFPRWPRAWQRSSWVASRVQGGPVREVGPHFFHLIVELFGPVDDVLAANDYPSDAARCERAAIGLLRLRSGPLVLVRVITGITIDEQIRLMVYGDRGTLGLLDGHRAVAGPATNEAFVVPEMRPLPASEPPPASLLDRLAGAVDGRPTDLCDFRSAVEVQRLLDGWTRAVNRGDGSISPGLPSGRATGRADVGNATSARS